MDFKCNGVYLCSLVDEDFKPGNFLSKNSKLKLVENVLNVGGYGNNSMFNMKKSFFFLSFYEEDNQIKGASFGYSWMSPFDIADTFIGMSSDRSNKMLGDCKTFQLKGEIANFTYFFVNEIFEIKCYLKTPKYNSTLYEPGLIANIRNVTKSIESKGMHFRFVSSLEANDLSHRNYEQLP